MIKLLIAGDYCPIGRTEDLLNTKNYASLFNGFEKITNEVDYAIVNLECPLTSSNNPIDKTGPCIKSENKNALEALKFAGFNMVTLANNHIQDFGHDGVIDTIRELKQNGINYVGAGYNKDEASRCSIVQIKDKNIGFINIAENEFCTATSHIAGANTLDLIENVRQIKSLKEKVDYIVMIYHGGREHYQLPTPKQRKRLRFFIENGVDAIVAHHTHCVSGFEYYLGKPIIYSLGNFIFDYKKKYQKGLWTEGMSVVLTFDSSIELNFIPHFQGRADNHSLQILEDIQKKEFLNRIQCLSEEITNDEKFYLSWNNYIKTQEKFYLSSLYINNFFLRVLFIKGVLPINLLKSKHNKLLLNLNRCETHQEITQNILELNHERKTL